MATESKMLVGVAIFQMLLGALMAQAQDVDCTFPGIDRATLSKDVLGDLEKSHVCALPRPDSLCARAGKAGKECKAIARAVGGVSDVRCSRPHVCSFTVKRPVQHPSRPGTAHVSLCRPEFMGVIFPCVENNLIIGDPTFRDLEDE